MGNTILPAGESRWTRREMERAPDGQTASFLDARELLCSAEAFMKVVLQLKLWATTKPSSFKLEARILLTVTPKSHDSF